MMKKATLGAFLVLFILGAAAVRAEDVSKFGVVPAVGYRTNSSFSITSEEVDFTRIRFEGAFAYGLSVGYRLSEFLAVEAMWSRSDTKVVGVFSGDPAPPNEPLFGASQDQFHANVMLSAGYSIGPLKPYFLVGAGATIVNPEGDIVGAKRFSWSLGTGFDAMVSKRIGIRAQAKFTPTYINTTDQILLEWTGGFQATSARNNMTQWEFTAGAIFRF